VRFGMVKAESRVRRRSWLDARDSALERPSGDVDVDVDVAVAVAVAIDATPMAMSISMSDVCVSKSAARIGPGAV
jgi:putative Mn2+ efflux pump MntP